MAHNEVVIVLQNNEVVARTVVNRVVVSSPGPQGPPGPQGEPGLDGVDGADGAPGGSRFSFVQAAPSSVWVVNHNLGYYPHVSTLVSDELIIADVVYGSLNQVTITFGSPTSGRAELS